MRFGLSKVHIRHLIVRAARLRNKIGPENILNRYEKWVEKREKGSEKRSETCPKMLSPSHAAYKFLTGALL